MIKKTLLTILLPVIIFGQNSFNVDFDYAHFYGDSNYSTIEFYYSFTKKSLTQVQKSDGVYIAGKLRLQIFDSSKSTELVNDHWDFESILDPEAPDDNQKLTGLLRYYLSSGNYKCILKGIDLNNSSISDSLQFELNVPKYDEKTVLLSDLQLANEIAQDSKSKSSPFYKNTLEVVPNPSALYGHGVPVFYFYYEIYNISNNVEVDRIKVVYELKNTRGETSYKKTKFMPASNSSVLDIGAIKVNGLVTGPYDVIVTVNDSLSNLSASTKKRIFVYNPDNLDSQQLVMGNSNFLSSEFITMSEEELDKNFSQARYISSDAEKLEWKKISQEEAKREYLYNFWAARDENPSTPVNETLMEYNRRIQYATEKYSDLSNKEGWTSDRGRIYILYGKPSEVERNPFDTENVPYELWYYNHIEGGVFFVFADFSSYSNYVLLHSTKRGELSDENWKNKTRR